MSNARLQDEPFDCLSCDVNFKYPSEASHEGVKDCGELQIVGTASDALAVVNAKLQADSHEHYFSKKKFGCAYEHVFEQCSNERNRSCPSLGGGGVPEALVMPSSIGHATNTVPPEPPAVAVD